MKRIIKIALTVGFFSTAAWLAMAASPTPAKACYRCINGACSQMVTDGYFNCFSGPNQGCHASNPGCVGAPQP